MQILIYSQRGLEIWELGFLLQSEGISLCYLTWLSIKKLCKNVDSGALPPPPLVMFVMWMMKWLLNIARGLDLTACCNPTVRIPPYLTPRTSAGDQPLLMGLRCEQKHEAAQPEQCWLHGDTELAAPRRLNAYGRVLNNLGTSSIGELSRGCSLQWQYAKGRCPTWL